MSERKICPNLEINLKDCGCTYVPCEISGSVMSAYTTIGKETNFSAAYFHPKLKKPTIDQSKNLYNLFQLRYEWRTLILSTLIFSSFKRFWQIFYNLSSLTIQLMEE